MPIQPILSSLAMQQSKCCSAGTNHWSKSSNSSNSSNSKQDSNTTQQSRNWDCIPATATRRVTPESSLWCTQQIELQHTSQGISGWAVACSNRRCSDQQLHMHNQHAHASPNITANAQHLYEYESSRSITRYAQHHQQQQQHQQLPRNNTRTHSIWEQARFARSDEKHLPHRARMAQTAAGSITPTGSHYTSLPPDLQHTTSIGAGICLALIAALLRNRPQRFAMSAIARPALLRALIVALRVVTATATFGQHAPEPPAWEGSAHAA
jgi:hypothetical protein